MRITCSLMAPSSESARASAALLGCAEGAAGLLGGGLGRSRRGRADHHLHGLAQRRRLHHGALAVAETGAHPEHAELGIRAPHPEAPRSAARPAAAAGDGLRPAAEGTRAAARAGRAARTAG